MPRTPGAQDVVWHGRQQIVEAMPRDGRGTCTDRGCDRELCYCKRCVYPESMRQASMGPFCHECWADILGWGPGRKLHHCSTCSCVEGEGWG